jgi:holo-[acyl-carrier protein] synthase
LAGARRGRLLAVIAGVGVDIVDIARLEAALRRTPELAARLFTEGERTALGGRLASASPGDSARSVASLAGSFAAKEALAKVLGAPAGLRWTDAEVVRDPTGRPFLHVRGTVAAAAERQGIATWHLSLSHDGGICVAMVVGERGGQR